MPVYVELVTDAFEDVYKSQSAKGGAAGDGTRRVTQAGRAIVRRPTRGIELKSDTYAYLKIIQSNGKELPFMDSSSSTGSTSSGYANFILQAVNEDRMEKHQIVETFGDSYVFFFGESPRFLDCQALLISSQDFTWDAEWWYNYEHYLRGTKLVEMGARAYMFWDDNVVEGYMLSTNAQRVADNQHMLSMSFRFFVTRYQNVNLSNVEQFPVRASLRVPDGVDLTGSDAFDRMQKYYRGGAPAGDVSTQSNLASTLAKGGVGTGTLASTSPSATQVGPGTFTFGKGNGGTSTAASLGIGVSNSSTTQGSIGSASSLSQAVRTLPPSMVVDPAVWSALTGTVGTVDIETQTMSTSTGSRGNLRGLIADNVDEYVNGADGYSEANALGTAQQSADPRYALNSAVAAAQNMPNGVASGALSILGLIGAAVNNPLSLVSLGLGPNFTQAYLAGVAAVTYATAGNGQAKSSASSFGGTSGQSVSFSPVPTTVGGSTAFSGRSSASAGYYAGSQVAYSGGYTYKDPLGAVYGRATTAQTAKASGYRSPYGDAGYGAAGFGDLGGAQHGSASSASGDPGYRDTSSVSSAAELRPTPYDGTALTEGPTVGALMNPGGASTEVLGRSSAFSTVAFDGVLSDFALEAVEEHAASPAALEGAAPDIGVSARQRSLFPEYVTYAYKAPTSTPLATFSGF